ncbi:hypothetical protein Rsub_09369 [Raphidocelis subcapitata]|uniref:Ataxin-10 domain-containing protein n=1 Tax=Raphidocelis subcapitata TaxID=307507 RepID=A0A2V0PFD2_9CHLO|nr:hypothetical protein Rsub_09369 [Raphidocelis subcapitata]|eukprot:GBF96623.1 hypothetical protein Rsub_09369 [Raphidocelis subcapitata]
MRQPTSEQLAGWLEESKSPEGRRRLLADGAAAAAARALPRCYVAWHDDRGCEASRAQLLACLRLLRNVCAAGAPAAAELMRCGAHMAAPAVAADAHAAVRGGSNLLAVSGERQLLLAAAQLLANMSVASEAAAGALWQECFPAVFGELTATPDVGVQAAVTLAMLSAAKAAPAAAEALASRAAARVWLQLLHPLLAPSDHDPDHAPDHGAGPANDCLGLLVKAVALQHGLLEPLLRCLEAPAADDPGGAAGDPSGGGASPSGWRWNALHVAVLHVVAQEVAGPSGGGGGGAPASRPPDGGAAERAPPPRPGAGADAAGAGAGGAPWRWPRAALRVVCDAATDVRALEDAGNSDKAPPGWAGAAPQVLDAAMQLLRAAAQREDGCAPLCGGADAMSLLLDPAAAPPLRLAEAREGERAGERAEQSELQEQAQDTRAKNSTQAVRQAQAVRQEQEQQQQQEQEQAQTQKQNSQQNSQQNQQAPAAAGEAAAAAAAAAPPEAAPGSGSDGSLIDALLALLAALGPPLNPRRPDAAQHARLRRELVALLPPAAAARAEAAAPARAPYPGYRADLLCALSNALHARAPAQRAAAAAGASELLLSNTQLDEAAPLAREWALWGVRNLCAGRGGEEARARMAALRLREVVAAPELEGMGVKVEVDARGKLSVVSQRA